MREPGNDLLTAFVAADDGCERLSREELLSLVVTLYSAGHRTTRDLFTNGLFALLAHPDQYRAVAVDPELAPAAMNEMLRFQTPTLYVARVAGEGASILGVDVPTLAPILLFLAAANRDPARFTDPDVFDITRDEGAPLSFAFGAHHCLGASVPRCLAGTHGGRGHAHRRDAAVAAIGAREAGTGVVELWSIPGPGLDHLYVDIS